MELYWIWGAVAVTGLWNWLESRETGSDHHYENEIAAAPVLAYEDEPLILGYEEIGGISINENLQ